MPVKGIERVKRRYGLAVKELGVDRAEVAVFEILRAGGAQAMSLTPMDTGNLARSQTAPQIDQGPKGVTGRIGYTAAYAAAVHEMPGTLKGQPRGHFGTTAAGVAFGGGTEKGNYWDPDAEPQFLKKGFEEIKPAIPAILRKVHSV